MENRFKIFPFWYGSPFDLIAEVKKVRAEQTPDGFTCSAKGFAVPTGRTISVDAAKFAPIDLYRFAKNNAGTLMVWRDGAKVHIGTCVVAGGIRDAVKIASKYDLNTVFDLKAGSVIRL